MLAPEAINLLKNEEALRLAHQTGALLLNLTLLDVIGIAHLLLQEGLELLELQTDDLLGGEVLQEIDEFLDLADQADQIPLLRRQVRINVGFHNVIDGALAIAEHLLLELTPLQDAAALSINSLTLIAHHFIVLKDLLTNVEVIGLNLFLGSLERARQHAGFDRHILLDPKRIHQTGDPITTKNTQQVIFQREEKTGAARIPLAGAAAPQLVVNPTGFMAFGANHVEATGLPYLDPLGLDHTVVFRLDRGRQLPESQDFALIGGALFSRLGDALFQFKHGETAITPSRHQIAGHLA